MALLVGHVRQRLHFEAVVHAGLAQQVDVAATLVAKTEVFAHQQPFGLQALDQQVFDERIGRHFSQPGVEALYHHLRDAVARQRRQLVAQARDSGRRQFGALVQRGEILPGMRLERHHGRGKTALAGGLADASQHGLMPAMDAVEIADRQRARSAPVGRRQGSVDTQRWFHEREFTILDSGFVPIPPNHSRADGFIVLG
ncbi:hypothetical protein D3C87_1307200 [compost metagenome]